MADSRILEALRTGHRARIQARRVGLERKREAPGKDQRPVTFNDHIRQTLKGHQEALRKRAAIFDDEMKGDGHDDDAHE